ncbi:MAG: methylenetetrahydrofolate reductase [Buchananella hordeovulneris]|nr:methylenetetrahydrofolate reductase [Buchananella hordeovulneris]
MSTRRLFTGQKDRPLVSFEFFPPRSKANLSLAWAGIDKLLASEPDMVSVTYGAGGSTQEVSQAVLSHILERTSLPPVAHLTCIGATRAELTRVITDLLELGVRDFLALRGDLPRGETWETYRPPAGALNTGAELVSLVREVADTQLPGEDVSISVAAYPGKPGERFQGGLDALKEKVDAGADYAITQVFFEASDYAHLRQAADAAGIDVPILPGFVPLTDPQRTQRVAELAGLEVPEHLAAALCQADPVERVRAGLRVTLDLISGTLAAGAPGVHLYTFNRPRPSLDILEYLFATKFLSTNTDRRFTEDLVEATLTALTPAR